MTNIKFGRRVGPQHRRENRQRAHGSAEREPDSAASAAPRPLPCRERRRRDEYCRLRLGQRGSESQPAGEKRPLGAGGRECCHRGQREERFDIPEHAAGKNRPRVQPVGDCRPTPGGRAGATTDKDEDQPDERGLKEEDQNLDRDRERDCVGERAPVHRAIDSAEPGELVQRERRIDHRTRHAVELDHPPVRRGPGAVQLAGHVYGAVVRPDPPDPEITGSRQRQRRGPDQQARGEQRRERPSHVGNATIS